MAKLSYFRAPDIEAILKLAAEGYSSSVVGLSNVGKSTLLRTIGQPEVQAHSLGKQAARFVFIFVDCNLMLTLTPQGFYEVTLRAALDALKSIEVSEALMARLNELYRRVVEPPSDFAVPLSFNDAIDLLSLESDRHIVFLFDEFDEPFEQLDGRVFLNLRALSDKFGSRLCYVVATTTRLEARNTDGDLGEFIELFVGHQRTLGMLADAEARALAAQWARAEGAELDAHELDFIIEQAGGHPGLIQAVTRAVVAVEAGVPLQARSAGLAHARERLEDDQIIRAECGKLWKQLPDNERDALIERVLEPTDAIDPSLKAALIEKGMLAGEPPRVFGAYFSGFVRRQRRARHAAPAGVWVDVDAGEVSVDGRRAPTLTDLEYRLLLLLWGRLDKVCDKYQIVESVWGQDYIDEVDDARIEKLISRLRAKLEQDPANPHYLQTVRGRGYKLVGV